MAKITIKDLYYGDKYSVTSEVFKTMFLASPNKAGVDEQTVLELEIVRQTLIEVDKMKKNGDCIVEGELGDAVTVSACGGSDEKHLTNFGTAIFRLSSNALAVISG